jgi:hypothetical protein
MDLFRKHNGDIDQSIWISLLITQCLQVCLLLWQTGCPFSLIDWGDGDDFYCDGDANDYADGSRFALLDLEDIGKSHLFFILIFILFFGWIGIGFDLVLVSVLDWVLGFIWFWFRFWIRFWFWFWFWIIIIYYLLLLPFRINFTVSDYFIINY